MVPTLCPPPGVSREIAMGAPLRYADLAGLSMSCAVPALLIGCGLRRAQAIAPVAGLGCGMSGEV